MTPVLANPNPQYSLTGLRIHPEAVLCNPAAQARLQARPLRAYVRVPACTLDSTCGPSMGLPQASRSHCDPEQGECDQVTLLLSQWGSRHSKASLRKLVAK